MKFEGITKRYGDLKVFDDFSLEIEEGSVAAIFGASGVGKTTLLRIAAGLTDYEGKTEGAEACAFVFQERRLLPASTVLENLLFVLPPPQRGRSAAQKRAERARQREEASQLLEAVGLKGYENRYPATLSGGEAQRVSLARAFLYPAATLLMDEPFGGLDVGKKGELIELFLRLKEGRPRTTLFVTHDIDDGLLLATDRIVLGGSPAKVVYRSKIDAPLDAREERFGRDYAEIRAAIVG